MAFPISTTNEAPGRKIEEALGIVNARVVAGMNVILEWFAGWSDTVGGRSTLYQSEMDRIQRQLLQELEVAAKQLGANGIVGLSIDYDQFTGAGKSMLIASALGTAVRLEERRRPAFAELRADAEATDVRSVLNAVRTLIRWADTFIAGGLSEPKNALGISTATEWAAAVEREGPELIDRFLTHLRASSSPRAKLLEAQLLCLKPERASVDTAAVLLEDRTNLPEFEGIANVVSSHWPLIVPRLSDWTKRGGPYRALAMKIVAYGTNTSVRLADVKAFEDLIATVRETHWASGNPPASRWACGCGASGNAPGQDRCTRCGLLTGGMTGRDVPFHPSELLAALLQQHRLLRFLQPPNTPS